MQYIRRSRIRHRAATTLLVVVTLLAGCSGEDPQPTAGEDATADGGATTQAPTGGAALSPRHADIAYVPDGTPEHTLDVYLPGSGPGPFPVVIWVHGGGWRMGDKSAIGSADEQMSLLTQRLLDNGYAVAAPNYRLVPTAKFPEPMQDVAAAVRYLRANAAQFQLDPAEFALMGDSAGAHLGAMAALTSGNAQLQGDLGETGADSSVKAFIGYYGIYDLKMRTEDQLDSPCGEAKPGTESSHGQLIGADPDSPDGESVAAAGSPVTYVNGDSPAVLLISGRYDCTAPYQQAERFHADLKAAGATTELSLIDAPHGDDVFFTDPQLQEQVLEFLKASFGG